MTTTPQRPPVVVGDYTLLAKIGEGGMGIVHLARRSSGERVALKVLRPHIVGDDEARHRLAREVSSLRRIRSRWVAEIVDADPWAEVPYVATRYVPGLSLHDHVVEEGPVRGRDLLWLATCLAQGVASVHREGVLHRDVKPSNVLMEGRTPILIDFGLARVADDPRLTHTGWLLGTPGYLAPEILYGDDATTASDVHSWASTVAFAATGSAPFGRGPSMAIMDRVRRGEHDLTGVPAGVRGILQAALDPEPAHRPRLPEIIAALTELSAAAVRGGSGDPDREVTDRFPVLDPAASETRPVGWVAEQAAGRPTDVLTPAPAPAPAPAPPAPVTRVLTAQQRPVPPPVQPPAPAPAAWGAPPAAPPVVPPAARWRPPAPVQDDHDAHGQDDEVDPGVDPEWWVPAEDPGLPAPGFLERSRRAILLVAAALALGVVTAALPWWTLATTIVVVWLLRSGSLAASAAGDRRRLRGRRWYDGALFLLRAPWDLVRSLPGTIMLVLWSAGLAVSAALLCYAAATSVDVALAVTGTAFALSLWTGPGGSRVRSPLTRVYRPLSRTAPSWLVALVVLCLVGGGSALLVQRSGPAWSPGSGSPVQRLFPGS